MILSLPELTSYTGGWEGVRSRPSEPCFICHSNGREPYQSTYFLDLIFDVLIHQASGAGHVVLGNFDILYRVKLEISPLLASATV